MFESYKFGKYKIAYEKCLKMCGDDTKCLRNVSEKFLKLDFTLPNNIRKSKSLKKSKSKSKSKKIIKKSQKKNKK